MPIDKGYEDLIKSLIAAQAQIGQATADGGQRPWLDFKDQLEEETETFTAETIRKIFSRQACNDTFGVLKTQDGAQTKAFQSCKLQNDFLAGMERDQGMRHRPRVRCLMHASGRAAANGLAGGPLRRNALDFLIRLLGEDVTPSPEAEEDE